MAGCEDMDALSLTLLKSMEELVKTKVEMEKNMSEGFILLAKARMLMGKERISMMQVPSDDEQMVARYCICREESSEEILPLAKRMEASLKLNSNNTDAKEKSDNAMQLRRRKGEPHYEVGEEKEGTRSILSQEPTRLAVVKKSDLKPLKWFGVLVPNELKIAQKAFEKSVSLSVECANIQNKIAVIKEALAAMKASEKIV
ncbi:coiled-coil domain-containing protein 115-like isoform X2 [Ischnura elegans]|nr:coiled-coil domain-containing protein 115-like isoform X2 [Ischnura elegans]